MKPLHRDESGAIALLALAGLLITFMTALTLFDGGFAVRHKFKAQISADAGAYSQAATKARVMNTVAFMNVMKRTLAGMWSLYVGMMYQFYQEARGDAACAFAVTWDIEFLRFLMTGDSVVGRVRDAFREHQTQVDAACDKGAAQYEVFWHEVFRRDWMNFSGVNITYEKYEGFVSAYTPQVNFDSSPVRNFQSSLRRLDRMQEILIGAAPKWSMVEGMVRARASGADRIDAFETDLPTRKGIREQVCLRGYGHLDGSIAAGSELVREIQANEGIHTRRSDRDSKFKKDYEAANVSRGLWAMGDPGCPSLRANFDDSLAPWVPTQPEVQDYVITGRETPLESYRPMHFEFMEAQGDLGHPQVPTYEGVSCGEVEDLAPEFRGFRASWVARIAPVGKCRPANGGWWK